MVEPTGVKRKLAVILAAALSLVVATPEFLQQDDGVVAGKCDNHVEILREWKP